MADLDAYFHLYGIGRDDVDDILETFWLSGRKHATAVLRDVLRKGITLWQRWFRP